MCREQAGFVANRTSQSWTIDCSSSWTKPRVQGASWFYSCSAALIINDRFGCFADKTPRAGSKLVLFPIGLRNCGRLIARPLGQNPACREQAGFVPIHTSPPCRIGDSCSWTKLHLLEHFCDLMKKCKQTKKALATNQELLTKAFSF